MERLLLKEMFGDADEGEMSDSMLLLFFYPLRITVDTLNNVLLN